MFWCIVPLAGVPRATGRGTCLRWEAKAHLRKQGIVVIGSARRIGFRCGLSILMLISPGLVRAGDETSRSAPISVVSESDSIHYEPGHIDKDDASSVEVSSVSRLETAPGPAETMIIRTGTVEFGCTGELCPGESSTGAAWQLHPGESPKPVETGGETDAHPAELPVSAKQDDAALQLVFETVLNESETQWLLDTAEVAPPPMRWGILLHEQLVGLGVGLATPGGWTLNLLSGYAFGATVFEEEGEDEPTEVAADAGVFSAITWEIRF